MRLLYLHFRLVAVYRRIFDVRATGSVGACVALPLLLPLLRASVLEPDLDLSIREVNLSRQLCLSLDRDVLAVQVLFLQFNFLVLAVHNSVLVLRARLS